MKSNNGNDSCITIIAQAISEMEVEQGKTLSMFDHFMTKYSYYDHSMADEAPLIEMTREELESDLIQLRTWIENRKK